MGADKTKEFLELVKQNPDLPIVPMVDSEIVAEDGYNYWLGSFGSASVNSYVCIDYYNGDSRFFTKDEQDAVEEYLADKIIDEWEGEELSDAEVSKMAHEQAEALPWVEAIVVWIGLPEQ